MKHDLKECLDRVFTKVNGNELAKQLCGPTGKPLVRQAVYRWTKVPLHHVQRISEITGIPDYEIRPDHYRNPTNWDGVEVVT